METARVGSRVTFTAKGRKVTGLVIKVRVKRARGKRAQLAEMYGIPKSELDRDVAEVVPDDNPDSYWTVALGSLTVLPSKLADKRKVADLKDKANTVKSRRKANQRQRQTATRERNQANATVDFYKLKLGSKIEVRMREGYWRRAYYHGLTKSGNVRVKLASEDWVGLNDVKIQTCSTKFVRLPVETK